MAALPFGRSCACVESEGLAKQLAEANQGSFDPAHWLCCDQKRRTTLSREMVERDGARTVRWDRTLKVQSSCYVYVAAPSQRQK